ncbi:hypothetical protein FB567DRAFT_499132 [Paraphoma chrysanthemicola]|uniref:Uncharacterized protein n=1 Tax=Paraphoma chrysanthemicola TaxID=798071 RepID=A0A8K0R0U2_9PLEO|nr:hypothetical protein FB567DRAFT_499132 [Paraphoma chrysanthemicola]
MFHVVLLALVIGRVAFAADCFQDEQRKGDTPTGNQIGKALTPDLGNICATTFKTNDDQKLQITYNHWMINLSIQRMDNTKPLKHCQDAFNNIISQCIQDGNTWGGVWSLDNESYNITNSVYPANGLGPNDEGGVPIITLGPQTGIETGTFATETSSIDGLTANSVTSTSADGHPTILPIWFSAFPIDKPGCQDASEDVKSNLRGLTFPDSIRTPDGKDNKISDLLYRLRQVVCDGSCAVPEGMDSKYVAVYQNGGECEVSIGLSTTTEIYFYRSIWPGDGPDFNTIWQQCWDSTDNIIKKCVKNSAKSGWWNGDHVYQFYQGGLRALNDPTAKHAAQTKIGSWLEPPTEGLDCNRDCCGMVLNGVWCNQNCGGPTCRRGTRSEHFALRPRATQSVAQVGGCMIRYVLPDYPSSGTASGKPEVVKWYDRDNSVDGDNNCDNPLIKLFGNRQTGNSYDTEHVYEKHLVKRFLYFLIGGEQAFDDDVDPSQAPPANPSALPVSTCIDLQAVFGSLSNAANSQFGQETVAAKLGKAVSCFGSACPDTDRLSEFFLLRKEINGMKNRIISGHFTGIGSDGNDNKLPSCNPSRSAAEMQQQMINAALVVQYLRQPAVFDSFNTVNNRMKSILHDLDNDPLGSNQPPRNLASFTALPNSWESAYDEFMARLLQDTERKMSKWLFECKNNYALKVDNDPSLTAAQKTQQKNNVAKYAGTRNNPDTLQVHPQAVAGVYAEQAMSWGHLYDRIRGGPS